MNRKEKNIFIILLILVITLFVLFLAVRNMPFFDVKQTEVNYSGPVSGLSPQIDVFISQHKGVNLFKIQSSLVKKKLGEFEGVANSSIRKFFPDTLIFNIEFIPYSVRLRVTQHGQAFFFVANNSQIEEVSRNTFLIFNSLPEIEINTDYAYSLKKWGIDNGFAQMCSLVEKLGNYSLITGLKYDNNNGNEFGLLELELKTINTVLRVREPVTFGRLEETLVMITREKNMYSDFVQYDLYSRTLIKRDI